MDLSAYKCVWKKVHEAYKTGYCIYERGLQALLYKELSTKFPRKHAVIEPHWDDVVPDVVIVSKDEITDIFEIKFVPAGYPKYQKDIEKLEKYGKYKGKVKCKWKNPYEDDLESLQISTNCNLHFVVVGRDDSPAVKPENISNQIILWYGRISQDSDNDCWGISEGKKD